MLWPDLDRRCGVRAWMPGLSRSWRRCRVRSSGTGRRLYVQGLLLPGERKSVEPTDAWVKNAERRRAARVPDAVEGRTKWRIALDEIARLRAQGVRFGCVLGDAEYGKVAAFRHALDDDGLLWALGIPPNQKVFSTSVTTALPPRKPRGRARQAPRALRAERPGVVPVRQPA